MTSLRDNIRFVLWLLLLVASGVAAICFALVGDFKPAMIAGILAFAAVLLIG
jgi:hypothetical protein